MVHRQRKKGRRLRQGAFYDLSMHKYWLSPLKRKKKPSANIHNYASFSIALCGLRCAFERIILSHRIGGRLGKGKAPGAGTSGESAAFVSLGVQPGIMGGRCL